MSRYLELNVTVPATKCHGTWNSLPLYLELNVMMLTEAPEQNRVVVRVHLTLVQHWVDTELGLIHQQQQVLGGEVAHSDRSKHTFI